MLLSYPGVLLPRDAASNTVKGVELIEFDKLLGELDSPGRVPNPVQGRGVESEADNVGYDEDDDTAHTRLGGQSNLEGELSTVVVHAAAVHETEDVLDGVTGQDSLASDGTDASIGQRTGQHRHTGRGHLYGAGLDVEVQDVLDVDPSALVMRSTEDIECNVGQTG